MSGREARGGRKGSEREGAKVGRSKSNGEDASEDERANATRRERAREREPLTDSAVA